MKVRSQSQQKFNFPENKLKESSIKLPKLPLNSQNINVSLNNQSSLRFWEQKREKMPINNPLKSLKDSSKVTKNVKNTRYESGEIRNENSLKEEIKNIEVWIFDNILKGKFFEQTQSNDSQIEKLIRQSGNCQIPDIDLRMIDRLLYESKKKKPDRVSRKSELLSARSRMTLPVPPEFPDEAILKKIAVTSETINNEYNKGLMMQLVQRKLSENKESINWNKTDLQMYAKVILMDFISTFEVLKIFKHHNISHMKDQLLECKQSINRSFSTNIGRVKNSPTRTPLTLLHYESALLDNYNQICKEIKLKKAIPDNLRLRKNNENILLLKKQTILAEVLEKTEKKEGQCDFKRRTGEQLNISDFMELNELKNKYFVLKTEIEQNKNENLKIFSDFDDEIKKAVTQIEELKFKKKLYSIKMQEFYLQLLKNEDDLILSEKTLVFVITNLWKLKSDVKPNNFPKMLLKTDVEFCIEYSKKYYEFIQAKLKTKVAKKAFKNKFNILYKKIVNEKENSKIESLQKSILNSKSGNLRLFKKLSTLKNPENGQKWEELKVPVNIFESGLRNTPVLKNKSINGNLVSFHNNLPILSELLLKMKQDYVHEVVSRVSGYDHIHITGDNSFYLKKLFTLIFGTKEAQILMNEIRREKVANNK